MNNRTSSFAYVIGILGLSSSWPCSYTRCITTHHPAPVGQARTEERTKALAEIRQAEAKGLNEYSWVDQGKGIVSLPIARAKELMLQEYKNPAAVRTNMIARADLANVPPPKPPEKPNQYQ